MRFSSDNAAGASPQIMDAIVRANAGAAMPYGADDWTRAAEDRLREVFECDCQAFFTPTGTAANALALACASPPWGAIFAQKDAHVMDDECGAPEFFSHGARMIGVPGAAGKIDPTALRHTLAAYPRGLVKQVQPAALSLSQATESGTAYSLAELAELTAIAREASLRVHMDGARFANALVALGVSPAAMTWQAGVDMLSFGATKNGALMCEAVIFFDRELAAEFVFRRKRGGHTVSKARFLGAQMLAYLDKGHWLDLARRANAQAQRLASGLQALRGVRLPWPTEVNEVFALLPADMDAALRQAGAWYHDWSRDALGQTGTGAGAQRPETGATPGQRQRFVRLVTSFATTEEEVDRLLTVACAHQPPAK